MPLPTKKTGSTTTGRAAGRTRDTGRDTGRSGFRRPVTEDVAPARRPGRTGRTEPTRETSARTGRADSGPRSGRAESARTPADRRREKPKTTGWDSVVERKEELENQQDFNDIRPFYLKDGETSIIQYLDEEPFAFEGHRIANGRGGWDTVPCQLEKQRHCLMCQDGEKASWNGAMRVLDYRGKWDKEAKDFTWDEPVEKLHIFGIQYAQQLKAYLDKKRKNATDLVIEISKSGSGKTSSHNLAPALDEQDRIMQPIVWESEYASAEELVPVPSDADLAAKYGY
jgi:hypothetical protein